MKLAMMLPAKPDLKWTLARQVGVEYAVTKAAPDLSGLPFFEQFPNAIEYTVSWVAAVLFAYWASKYFVFESAKKEGSVQFFKFVASRLLTLILSLAGDFVLTGLLKMNEFLAKLIISVLVVIINYITSKLFVFNKKLEEEETHDGTRHP